MIRKASRLLKSSLAVLLVFACVAGSGFPAVVRAEDNAGQTPVNTNLAADKTVTASAEYGSMPASNLTDDDTASRWSTERDATQWAYVDLGASYDMNYFSMIW